VLRLLLLWQRIVLLTPSFSFLGGGFGEP